MSAPGGSNPTTLGLVSLPMPLGSGSGLAQGGPSGVTHSRAQQQSSLQQLPVGRGPASAESLAFFLGSHTSLPAQQQEGQNMAATTTWLTASTTSELLTTEHFESLSLQDSRGAGARLLGYNAPWPSSGAQQSQDVFLDSAQELCESAFSSCSDQVIRDSLLNSYNGISSHHDLLSSEPGNLLAHASASNAGAASTSSTAANGPGSSTGGEGLETAGRSLSLDSRPTGPSSGHSGNPHLSHLHHHHHKDGSSPRRGEKPRGQGYRKLWQQVTKVSKGQRLQDNMGIAFSDMTVEDLLRIVLKLAPQESAVDAVSQGLYYLDSSALAALLKELSKQGHLKRSVEIFDWLRSLESSHELSALCDLYTYTTMISQCGSHQQLRRALELVAEMRSKGIECNVHTYSALMNVCIKANELELAQDVYKQMLDEGCTPNLVTYNILIDVYVKKGQWEEAVKVLDTIEKQGIQAEVRTYNTVISACNKSGQPEQALKVYEKMLSVGVKPSATTYTALISAYGKKGQVEKALDIFKDMIRRGCERNVITYSSLISACEKAGRWEMALELFNKMHKENCKPNVVTYNSLIAACSHGGHWEKASEFFEQMQTHGCKPDSITYSGLITAYERGGQWRRALKAFEQMQAQGCHPDAAVFNSLMEVLWQSGVLLAQVKALQLWSVANRNGHFRIYTNSKQETNLLQYSTVAFTCGAAVVTVLRWLGELRNKLVKDGPAFFRDKVVFTLHKSKQNRSEQPSAKICEAVSQLLAGNGSPFQLQLIEHTITLESGSAALVQWLKSQAFADIAYISHASHFKRMPLDLLFSEDVAVAARCIEAYAAVKRYESLYMLNTSLCPQQLLQQRPQAVHLALKYGAAFSFKEDTIYDGLQLFDRIACSGAPFNVNTWPLCLCSCVVLAAHQVEGAHMWPSYEQVALVTGFGADALAGMERNIVMWLQQDISTISPLRVIQLYLERLGHYLAEFKPVDRISKDLQTLMLKVACSPACIGVRPSMLAAAALIVVRRSKGLVPMWPMVLQVMTGYSDTSIGELGACVAHLETL